MKFVVSDLADNRVTLAVDPAVLTVEVAAEINAFWHGGAARLDAEGGDAVRAVVRLLGAGLIRLMQADGGEAFAAGDGRGRYCLECFLEHANEGWPDADELGIEIEEARVADCDFFDVALTRVAK